MADENKGETEVETENLQEKYDELLEELSLKDEEIELTYNNLFQRFIDYIQLNKTMRISEISNELVSFPHVYNIIKPKDGSEEYTIDLQEDMYHIQMNGRTPNYGIGMTSGDRVVSYFEQLEQK